MHKDYYEAIIQIRPKDREIFDFLIKQIEDRKNVSISKIVEKKYGNDIYISDKKFARTLGERLKKRFKGELKTSRKLHTRDRIKSKDVYRVTVCFRKEKDL